jgi:hypothetical protein
VLEEDPSTAKTMPTMSARMTTPPPIAIWAGYRSNALSRDGGGDSSTEVPPAYGDGSPAEDLAAECPSECPSGLPTVLSPEVEC